MDFSKNHLRDKANSADFRHFRRSVFREYASFIKEKVRQNYDWSVKFVMWLRQYIRYVKNEKTFHPSYLPNYKRGQIVFVNLGFRIGHELGGPHYGIVLDNDNRKKDGLITIIPMVSKKPKHAERGLRPGEYELPIPISQLIIEKASVQLAKAPYQDAMDSIDKLRKLDKDEQMAQLPIYLQEFERKLQQRIMPLISLSQKMNKGSIVDTRQITTVSKQRIITPVKQSDELYGVCVPEFILTEICTLIKEKYFQAGSLDD